MAELVSAPVVYKLSGMPDLPPFEAQDDGLYVHDEKGAIIDGCGYSAVGPVGDKGIAIYRVTTSQEMLDAIAADTKRWAVLSDKPMTEKEVTDLKALLTTDAKLAAIISKQDWTIAKARANTLVALGVTEAEYTQAKAGVAGDKLL